MNSNIKQNLADLHQIFALLNWDDTIFTHLSACISDNLLMKPYDLLFNEVTPNTLLECNIHEYNDSLGLNQVGYNIHSAIHANRNEVEYVLHTHTPEIVAISALKEGLKPVSQYATLVLEKGLSYHNYEGVVFWEDEKDRLVNSLKDNTFCLLKNHGSLVVGKTVEKAFFNQYLLQKSCEVQCLINGPVIEINNDIIKQFRNFDKSGYQASPLLWEAMKRKLHAKTRSSS